MIRRMVEMSVMIEGMIDQHIIIHQNKSMSFNKCEREGHDDKSGGVNEIVVVVHSHWMTQNYLMMSQKQHSLHQCCLVQLLVSVF